MGFETNSSVRMNFWNYKDWNNKDVCSGVIYISNKPQTSMSQERPWDMRAVKKNIYNFKSSFQQKSLFEMYFFTPYALSQDNLVVHKR